MKTAYATIKGFEVMRMFKKGQFTAWILAERIARHHDDPPSLSLFPRDPSVLSTSTTID